ncbi:hypothetical protein [Pedobacter sp. ASV28]|uniref:hypothetical protein n=1 Tax=Pedobacter sp. ASV28 TaxID=2795123 RepID=UPI0018EC5281|nr:hypothetical protein [Pedobacter sp. ASV28]
MIQLSYSPRVSNFVDAADVSGNIRNVPLYLQYLHQIDVACKKADITTGAVYPIVGGTATSHSFNFLNPAQYQVNWFGVVTHSSNGMQSDGTTGYGNTGIKTTQFNLSSGLMMGIYAYNTGTSGQRASIGAYSSSGGDTNSFQLRPFYNFTSSQTFSFGQFITLVTSPIKGSQIANKIPNVNIRSLARNGIELISDNTSLSNISINADIYILCYNNNNPSLGTNTPSFFSNNTHGLFAITNGISSVLNTKIFSHDIYTANRSIGR